MPDPALEYYYVNRFDRMMSRPAVYGFFASFVLLSLPFFAGVGLNYLPDSPTVGLVLALSLVLLPLICMIWCIIARIRINSSKYRGAGFATAGACISAVLAVLYLALIMLYIVALSAIGGV